MPSSTNDSIVLPEAPAIPGLVFRRFRGAEDFPAIAAVITASNAADGSGEWVTTEEVAGRHAHPVNWDPREDTLLAEASGALVGYAGTEWRVEDTGDHLHFIHLHLAPEWRDRGLEIAMQSHLEQRARIAASAGPNGARRLFAGAAAAGWRAHSELLLARGYKPVRHFFDMRRPLDGDLPEASLPAGLELRPARPEQYRAIWDANVESFRDHWGFILPTDEDYREWLEWPNNDPRLWLVAWDGDQVAGAAINIIQKNEKGERDTEGWVDDLYVRRPWRKRGLGRALLTGSLHLFKARGMTHAGLGVDSENLSGALRLYESVGFRARRHVTAYRKPM